MASLSNRGACKESGSALKTGKPIFINSRFLEIPGQVSSVGVPKTYGRRGQGRGKGGGGGGGR